uniref:Envelope protein n=1 Tax=Porcine epidemic diarrhea virus TaxID=28295 RepID=A0A1Q0XE06_PEDV|nr:envelope protein [Porcine epidemic diarrhea virus]
MLQLVNDCFYSWRYKNALFIIFNTTTLSFLNGKAAYYDGKSIEIQEGGDHEPIGRLYRVYKSYMQIDPLPSTVIDV